MAGASAFLYLRTFLLGEVPLVVGDDQVLFFVRAARMAHGQVLYRDFFELVTPGAELMYAAGFRVFGVHAWVMAAWGVVLGVALVGLVAHIAGRILRGWLVWLPGLLLLVFDYDMALDATHHWYSTLVVMAAVSLLMGGVSLRRMAGAGALMGVATLFTQTAGALVFLGVMGWLVWRGRRDGDRSPARLAAVASAYGLIVAGVLGYYVHEAGLRTVWFDLVVFPVRYLSSGEVNSPGTYLRQLPGVHGWGDVGRAIPVLFVYAMVPYCYLAGMYWLWRRRAMDAGLMQRLVLLHVVGVALFLSVASGPRLHRLCMVAPPAILIFVWMVSELKARQRLVGGLLYGVAAMFFVGLGLSRQVQRHPVLELPVGTTAFIDPLEFREFSWFTERTQPGEMFFNQNSIGLYLGLSNPSSSDFINTDDYTQPETVVRVIGDLKARPPRFVVVVPGRASQGVEHDHSGPFVEYVHERYRLAEVFPLNPGSRVEEVWELR